MSKKKPAAVKRSVPSAAATAFYIKYGKDNARPPSKSPSKTDKKPVVKRSVPAAAANVYIKYNFKPPKRKRKRTREREEADTDESEISVDLDYLEFNCKPPKKKKKESEETDISVVAAEVRLKKAFFGPKTDYSQKKIVRLLGN